MRAGEPVGNLLSAFGRGLRETRLTALLGLIMAKEPELFQTLFNIQGRVQSVSVEHHHESGRSDILVSTAADSVVVEAKIGATDASPQLARYPGARRVQISQYRPSPRERERPRYTFVSWYETVAVLLHAHARLAADTRTLSRELIAYLREHNMAGTDDRVEVYAREINEPESLKMFLRAAVYTCRYEKNSRLAEALYFAPHFGSRVEAAYPGVLQGISYVARIEDMDIYESWDDFQKLLIEKRGRPWFKKHRDYLTGVAKARPKHPHVAVLLGKPQLVFNPPIRKQNLQGGYGWLSKKYLRFEELFAAWGKLGQPAAKREN